MVNPPIIVTAKGTPIKVTYSALPNARGIRAIIVVIAVISIGSDTILHMTHKSRPNVDVTVQRCSMYGMQDIARYVYKHSISRRTHDNMIPRKTRYSLTFRKTIRD